MAIVMIIFVVALMEICIKIEYHLRKNKKIIQIKTQINQEKLMQQIITVLKFQFESLAAIQEQVTIDRGLIVKILKLAHLNDALIIYEMISNEFYQELNADLKAMQINIEKKYKTIGLILILLIGFFYLLK